MPIKYTQINNNELFDTVIKRLIEKINNYKARSLIFLSGGSVVGLYPLLGQAIEEGKIDRKKICFAQVDERYRPDNIEEVNAEAIEKTGLWKVCTKYGIPFHLISQELSFSQSVKAYDETVGNLFTLYQNRIAILGMGEDGHTAGLLPGYRKEWDEKQFVVGYKNDGLYPLRISITPFAIKQLSEGIVIALGDKKKEIINKLNSTEIKDINQYPVTLLDTIQNSKIYTDQNLVK
jgi:6-phosphogluconolactonase/glucosamine-6-phosphate isomerase/deaminase